MVGSWWLYPLLLVTGFVAGLVDSIAGGGGLITIPVLLYTGFDPQQAVATNKLQASFGSGSATWHYARAGWIDWRACRLGLAVTLLAAALGALAVQQVSRDLLRWAIPVLLIGIAVFLILRPQLGTQERQPKLPPAAFALLCGSTIGFYDGFFGPGTGTFWAMAYVLLLGSRLTTATAHTKAMNFASNAASLAVFLCGGQVFFLPGLVMGVGQWCGARAGSWLVIRRGVHLVRPVLITVTLAITAKLLWDLLTAK